MKECNIGHEKTILTIVLDGDHKIVGMQAEARFCLCDIPKAIALHLGEQGFRMPIKPPAALVKAITPKVVGTIASVCAKAYLVEMNAQAPTAVEPVDVES